MFSSNATAWTKQTNQSIIRDFDGADASPAAQTTGTDISERVLVSTVVEDYTYVYTGGKLMQMTVTTTTTTGDTTETASETLTFAYDASGIPMSVTDTDSSNTTNTYYYATNIQGDVTALLNTSGTAVVEYTYDAWGNILSTTGSMAPTLGETNPLRYRGYVYDTETGLYYLQSRYYNPEMGRFLNADSYASTGVGILGCNIFVYCNNNPITYSDSDGNRLVPAYRYGSSGGSKWYELYGNWRYRIDTENVNTRTKTHVHVQNSRTKKEYIQNDDGSPHDKGKGQKGELPNKLQKTLMEKTGWDYNGKRKKFFEKTSLIGLRDDNMLLYEYADGSVVAVPNRPFVSDESLINYYYNGGGEEKANGGMLIGMPLIEGMLPIALPSWGFDFMPLVPIF